MKICGSFREICVAAALYSKERRSLKAITDEEPPPSYGSERCWAKLRKAISFADRGRNNARGKIGKYIATTCGGASNLILLREIMKYSLG